MYILNYFVGEGQTCVTTRTFGELRRDVARFAAAMRNAGIKTGDRVVGGFVKDRSDVHVGALQWQLRRPGIKMQSALVIACFAVPRLSR